MRMRAHRRNRVVWSSSAGSASRPGDRRRTRPTRGRRIRWQLRTGVLLAVIGAVRLARIARARRREAFLAAGTMLTVLGIGLGSMAVFFGGMLIWATACPWRGGEQAGR